MMRTVQEWMWCTTRACLAIVALATAASGLPQNAYAASVDFRFSPPNSISYVQHLTATKTKQMGAAGKITDVTVTETKITMTRSKSGYLLVARPSSMEMKRDGQKIDHPLFKVLAGIAVKYRLDNQGRIISVTGFGDLRDKLKAAMPPEVFQALAATMTEEAMNAKEIAEWNGRVGDFVGKSFAAGEAVLSTSEFPLPDGGNVTYYSATKVEGKAKCRTGNCVRVQFRYGSNPSSFVGFASGVMAKLSRLADASGKEKLKVVGSASIVGDGHRVIDHRTMLIYEERNSRTMKMVMDVPGKGKVPVTMIESRDYQFDYE